MDTDTARREFLKFLLASPLLTALAPAERSLADDSPAGFARALSSLIESPDDALDVFDFQGVAERTLPPAHYGYLATGTDGNETLTANRMGFEEFYLRPMRMVNTSQVDTSTELLGQRLSSPILLAPVSSQRAFHEDGELATARAARETGHLQILSNLTTAPLEEVVDTRGEPVWLQLYPTSNWDVTRMMIERAEKTEVPVLVLTVDMNGNSNRVPLGHYVRQDTRDCTQCHGRDPGDWLSRKPMYAGTGVQPDEFLTPGMTWDYIDRLRGVTDMKIVIKGIVTREDATTCVSAGVDAVYVSNHGGRAEASGRAAIESLSEVVEAVEGRVPVLVDSGFRRGTDIFKALALGANAVCVGRPYLWGLAAFGDSGVRRVLEIMQRELTMAMSQMGAPKLSDIGLQHIGRH